MRRAARTDDNHAEIVGALRACGATVQSLAAIGGGVPDLLVLHRNRLMLYEVKDGAKSPSKRRLTKAQTDWHEKWRGPHLMVVENVEQAIAMLAGEK